MSQQKHSSNTTLIHYARNIDERFDDLERKLESPVIAQWSRSKKKNCVTLINPEKTKLELLFEDDKLIKLKKITFNPYQNKRFVKAKTISFPEPAMKKSEAILQSFDEDGNENHQPIKHSYTQAPQKSKDGAVYIKRVIQDLGVLRFDLRNGQLAKFAIQMKGKASESIRLNRDGSVEWRVQKNSFANLIFLLIFGGSALVAAAYFASNFI